MKFPSWCCQRCGATIGWFGRAWEWLMGEGHGCPGLVAQEDPPDEWAELRRTAERIAARLDAEDAAKREGQLDRIEAGLMALTQAMIRQAAAAPAKRKPAKAAQKRPVKRRARK